MSATLSIIIPSYNEERNIQEVLDNVIADMPTSVSDYEIIVIDDGSTDATQETLRHIASQNRKIRIITHKENEGKGAALLSGFAQASMEWILFTDADLQISTKVLPEFIAQTSSYQIIIGYRENRGDSLLRQLFSKGYALLIRILFNIRLKDINCPFKLFRNSLLHSLPLSSCGFFIDTELLYYILCKGSHIKEIGVTGKQRKHGKSSVKLEHVVQTIRELIFLLKKIYKKDGTTH